MAPKKPVRRHNNKKNKRKSTTTANNSISSTHAHGPRFTTSTNNTKNYRWKAIPDECDNGEHHNVAASPGGGIYATYKQATQRFKECLFALVPMEMLDARPDEDNVIRVQTIMDAVDFLVQKRIDSTIPSTLLEDCRTSLHFRKRHAKSFVDGGDEGHSYFILVLQYCYQSLKQLVDSSTPKPTRKSSSQPQPAFRFTDLELDESEEEEDDDDADSAATTLIRPPEKDYTMDDLIGSTDRCQAILFFTNVDKCMGHVAQQYAAIRQMAIQLRLDHPPGTDDDDEYTSRLIGPLMTAAAVTNFCIRQVQRMEEEIKFDFPHFTTIYRIMVSFTLKLQIDGLEYYMKCIGKRVPRTELTAFVGDLVEQGFRLNDDYLEMCSRITMDLCQTWDLPFFEMEHLALQFLERALHETGMAGAVNHSLVPHQWTCGYQYIGGGRCILNTLSRLQQLTKMFLLPDPVLAVPLNFFGELWDEQRGLAKQIQGEMDQFLLEQIMPAVLFMCINGPLALDGVPMLNQLLPFIKELRLFVKEPQTPASMSLAFGVHAVLTSVFELQGDNRVANLAKAAENAYCTFFEQRDVWNLTSDRFRGISLPTDHQQIENYKNIPPSILQLMSSGIDDTRAKPMREHGVWDPYCAGMMLHNVSQAVNMRFSPFVNVNSQLRITLHLYNAFQLRGLIMDIPLLTALDTYYGPLMTIWGSEKATRETILTKYWIAEGWKAEVIRAFHKECTSIVSGEETSDGINLRYRDGRYNRRAYEKGCRAEDVSKTYRRICQEDFRGMMPSTTTSEEQVVGEHSNREWYMQFERYVHEIVETMTGEEELLSWNLCSLGDGLEGLLWYLADNLGWQNMLDDVVASLGPNDDVAWAKLHTIMTRLVYQVLGPLELIDAVEHDPVVVAVRDLFVQYFHSTLDPTKYKIFHTMKDPT